MKKLGKGVFLSVDRSMYIQTLGGEHRQKLIEAIAKRIRWNTRDDKNGLKTPRDWYR
jgi:hypothetical protein